MKVHLVFLTQDLRGQVVDALGTDSVRVLDGRLNKDNLISSAFSLFDDGHKMHRYVGFRVLVGSRFKEGKEIYRFVSETLT